MLGKMTNFRCASQISRPFIRNSIGVFLSFNYLLSEGLENCFSTPLERIYKIFVVWRQIIKKIR